MEPEEPLDELARTVLDGGIVDWDAATTADDPVTDSSIRALREISRIAAFNRALQRPAPNAVPLSAVGETSRIPSKSGQWGPFTLLELVGSGAAGEVWRAWEASLQRDVAIKFIQARVADQDGISAAALLEEARAVARVRHPGVVGVYGIAEHDGRAGIWMEFLRGSTLAAEIERRGSLPPLEVARIGVQLAAALEALEKAGLVHRDIKPANVVLERDGRAVLTDFGLGWRRTLLDTDAPRGVGTPLFMAPSLLAGEPPTPRTDVYALGVTLRWALTGRAPFRARTLEALKLEAARGPDTHLAQERPGAPASLVAAIERAMEPDASARRFTGAEMLGFLRAAADELELGASPAAVSRAAGAGPRAASLSIAVLPFLNHSRDEGEEYFSDGLADEILNVLAKIRGLRVSSRTSSFQFKGTTETLATIGRKLNVATILEGSARKAGNRIRVSVRLVSVADGYRLWSESYDKALDDIFAVQDSIAQSVLQELRAAFLGGEGLTDSSAHAEIEVAARGRGASGEAHRLFLQGRYFIDRGTREDTERGLAILKEAVTVDPTHALAWSELARAHMNLVNGVWADPKESVARAREAVERALALEPDLPDALARLGSIQKNYDWDWKSAEASYRRALDLAPGSAVALDGAGVLAETLGRTSEAIALMRRAVELDPLSAGSYSNIGITYHAAGRLAAAEEALRKAIELAPQRIATRASLALILLDQGRAEEALAEAMREPEEVYRLWALSLVHRRSGRTREADDARASMIERHAGDWSYQIAETYGAEGNADEAFRWLERAHAQRDPGLAYIKADPLFRPLHGERRWNILLARMSLAD